jgi:SAM-dependent methyltransferase
MRQSRRHAPDHGRFRCALELSHLGDGMTVVDWGCAHGWFAARIAERYPAARIVACDIPYPHGAPDFAASQIEFQLLNETEPRLALPDESVDRIFLLDVLEHMGDRSRPAALKEIRRVLCRHGLLVVTVPHRGLLHWTDVENVRLRRPRLHRWAFRLVRGKRAYADRYGANPHANFSTDAVEHHHYSERELVTLLSSAGFATRERRFFGVLYVVPWTLTMLLEALRRATRRHLTVLERAASSTNRIAVDATPPARLAESIGVAASPSPVAGLLEGR